MPQMWKVVRINLRKTCAAPHLWAISSSDVGQCPDRLLSWPPRCFATDPGQRKTRVFFTPKSTSTLLLVLDSTAPPRRKLDASAGLTAATRQRNWDFPGTEAAFPPFSTGQGRRNFQCSPRRALPDSPPPPVCNTSDGCKGEES